MATSLKSVYSKAFFTPLFKSWKKLHANFDSNKFLIDLMNEDWKDYALKQRISSIAENIHLHLRGSIEVRLAFIVKLCNELKAAGVKEQSFEYLFLAEYVSSYGLEEFEAGLKSLSEVTKFVSCEFAVRPFLEKSYNETLAFMTKCTTSKNENVRRFASEGLRPRLPWGKQVKRLFIDYEKSIPILEQLLDDDSLYVRKSVANHINDLSKDHPELVMKLFRQWDNGSSKRSWIIKRAGRTLFKKGYKGIHSFLGFAPENNVSLIKFELQKDIIRIGDDLHFEIQLLNEGSINGKFHLQYHLHLIRQNNKHNRSTFQIGELNIQSKEKLKLIKKHGIKQLSTRKFYPGKQYISISVNGKEINKKAFEIQL